MNRREFLWTIGAAAGSGLVASSALAQPPGNPKVYLFGMIVIDDSNGLAAIFPQVNAMAQHRSFLAASDQAIAALKGTPVDMRASGLSRVHPDFSYARWPSACCLSGNSFTLGAGTGSVQQSLQECLPRLTKLGSDVGITRRLTASLPSGSFTLKLGDGTLRLPMTRSTSLGTDPSVKWQFWNGGTALGAPMNLTDMAVFESAKPTLDISGNGGTLSMGPGDVIWFFNLPLTAPADNDAMTIEHASDPFTLLTPNYPVKDLTAKTLTKLTFPATGKTPLVHPCATTASAKSAAKQYAMSMHPGVVHMLYAPPDSDPCFMSAV